MSLKTTLKLKVFHILEKIENRWLCTTSTPFSTQCSDLKVLHCKTDQVTIFVQKYGLIIPSTITKNNQPSFLILDAPMSFYLTSNWFVTLNISTYFRVINYVFFLQHCCSRPIELWGNRSLSFVLLCQLGKINCKSCIFRKKSMWKFQQARL